MKDLSKYRGCLLGGAVGDALGFPVEFLSDEQISENMAKTESPNTNCTMG